MYLLIAVIDEVDYWFTGLATEAIRTAHAILIQADWWACVPISG